MTRSERFNGIEVLRFLCAVAIVVWHYHHFYVGLDGGAVDVLVRERQPLWWLLRVFYDHGYIAVWIFWQISGFVFFWKYQEAIARGEVGAWTFFVLRFSRLYPLHVATLVITALLQVVYVADHGGGYFIFGPNDLHHFLLNLGFASGWGLERGMTFNGPIWSVSAEVLAYAVFFAVAVAGAGRFGGRTAALVISVAIWAVNARFGIFPGGRLVLACCVFFFAGGSIHAAVERVRGELLAWVGPVAVILALLLAWTTFSGNFRFLAFVNHRGEAEAPKWAIFLVSSLLVLGFVALESLPRAARLFARVAPLGDTTYSSYLVHFPLQLAAVIFVDRLGLGRAIFDAPSALVLYLTGVFGLAWIVHHRFERPAQDLLRHAMLGGKTRRATAAGAIHLGE